MSAIQWEYELVERPFCELRQLKSGLMTDLLEGRVRVPDGVVDNA